MKKVYNVGKKEGKDEGRVTKRNREKIKEGNIKRGTKLQNEIH
jgi:hypothetical protein